MLSNSEIEQTLIGLALSDFSCAEKLSQLPKDTFTVMEHVILWQVIKNLVDKKQTPDPQIVFNQIGNEDQSMMALIMKCVSLGVSKVMYDQYENTALDLRRRRKLSAACSTIIQKVGEPGEDVDAITAELMSVVNDNTGRPQAQGMNEAMLDFVELIDKPNKIISTGIAGFDRINGGIRPGQLIYLGARPGVGKTALGLSIATHIARKTGPVLVASLEMTTQEIIERMMAAQTGLKLEKFVSHDISDIEWGTIWGQTSELSKVPMRFTMAGTPMRIKREAAAMKRNGGLSLIMIDYVGLLRGDATRYNSRYEEVSDISRQLKLIAMDLDVPILALTQFNRNPEHGKSVPSMADARDSGSLEQDCNVFLVQYAPKEPEKNNSLYEYWASCQDRGTEFQMLVCEKYRQGKTGRIPMEFDKPHMRFVTLAKE